MLFTVFYTHRERVKGGIFGSCQRNVREFEIVLRKKIDFLKKSTYM